MKNRHRFAVVVTVAAILGTVDLAHGDVLITVNKATQRLTVAVDGVELYRWPVSTARAGYTTPDGTYRPIRIERKWYSREYDNAPMPYAIFFRGGYAVHGSYEISRIGRPASHGCVRLNPANAKILFKLVKDASIYKTQVVIEGPDASVSPANARLAQSASAPQASDQSGQQSPREISGKASHLGRHQEQTAGGSGEGAQPFWFFNPFAALFSNVSNHKGSDEKQVATAAPATPLSKVDASNARGKRRQLVADKGRHLRRRAEQTARGPNEGAQPPRFINPFAALFSDVGNHKGSDEKQVAAAAPATPLSRVEARNARMKRRHLRSARAGRIRVRDARVAAVPIGRRYRARYWRREYRYPPPYNYHYRGRGLFTN